MGNYKFCLHYALQQAAGRSRFKVLDYGCGAGKAVSLMRAAGLDAYGCDPFYEGGDASADVPAGIRPYVIRMEEGRAPFDDASFDLIINNQVMEHVADLGASVSDMARLLRPGGICLSLFPHLEIWREGHCNVPLLHWLPRQSRLRLYYAAAFYRIGYFTSGKTRWQWAQHACDWLDKWCYYRPRRSISGTFAAHLSAPCHIESEWIVARAPIARFAPRLIRIFVARKFAGLVFVTRKPALKAAPALDPA